MAERYCFYCGTQLELKQTCNCRRKPTFTSTTAEEQTAERKQAGDKLSRFFANLQQRNSNFWQHVWRSKGDKEDGEAQKKYDSDRYKLFSNVVSMLRLLLIEPESAILFMRNLSLHQVIGYMLMHSSLLALTVSLFVGNTFLGRIIRSYLTDFIRMSISRSWAFEVIFVLQIIGFCLAVYAIKLLLVAYIFGRDRKRLPLDEAARILIVGIFYQLVFTGLALCFSVTAPVQFVCFLLMGTCLAFYAEVQSAVTLLKMDSTKAFTKWILIYMALFVTASLLAPVVLPQFSNYNLV